MSLKIIEIDKLLKGTLAAEKTAIDEEDRLKEIEDQRLKETEDQKIKEELASKLKSFDVDQNRKN